MSDRKLVLLPFLLWVIYSLLPIPTPHPLPNGMLGCIFCDEPWVSESAHLLVAVPLLLLVIITLLKTCIVLCNGRLPTFSLFMFIEPALWVLFFGMTPHYLFRAVRGGGITLTFYDLVSLFPFLFFAVVAFVFAKRLIRNNNRPLDAPRRVETSPFIEFPY